MEVLWCILKFLLLSGLLAFLWCTWGCSSFWKLRYFPGPSSSLFYGHVRDLVKLGSVKCYMMWMKQEESSLLRFHIGRHGAILTTSTEVIGSMFCEAGIASGVLRDRGCGGGQTLWTGRTTGTYGSNGERWEKFHTALVSSMGKFEYVSQNAVTGCSEYISTRLMAMDNTCRVDLGDVVKDGILLFAASVMFGIENIHSRGCSDLKEDLLSYSTVRRNRFDTRSSSYPFLPFLWDLMGWRHPVDQTEYQVTERLKQAATSNIKNACLMTILKDSLSNDEAIEESLSCFLICYETLSSVLHGMLLKVSLDQSFSETILRSDDPCGTAKMILYEYLRCYPPYPFIQREESTTVSIADTQIPGETSVIIPTLIMQRNANIDNPHLFAPDRFHDGHEHLSNQLAFFPFGIGERACPASPSATQALCILLVSILTEWRIVADNFEMLQFTEEYVYRPVECFHFVTIKRRT